jgi:hypothetical protein
MLVVGSMTGADGCAGDGEVPVVPGGDQGAPDGPGPDGFQDDNSFPSLKARLRELKEKQQAAAVKAMAEVSHCEDLCSIATQICEVAERLQVIADKHPQEESYQTLKREAQLECREAKQSCVNCVRGFESTAPNSTQPPQESSTEPQ